MRLQISRVGTCMQLGENRFLGWGWFTASVVSVRLGTGVLLAPS